MKRHRIIAGDLVVESVLRRGAAGETLVVSRRSGARRERHVLKWLPSVTRPDLAAITGSSHRALAMPSAFRTDAATGRRCLLRPYIHGMDLAQALRGKTPAEAIPWLASACDSLRILHEAGWAHGNLKAPNLLVPRSAVFSRRQGTPRVILCDPAASPPPGGDAASLDDDVLALGRVFYSIFAGEEPRPGPDGLPAAPAAWSPGMPVDLDRLLAWVLHPDPARRCRDVLALLEALRGLSGARAPKPLPPLDRPPDPGAVDRARSALLSGEDARVLAIAGEAGSGKSGLLRRIELEAELLGHRAVRLRRRGEGGSAAAALRASIGELIPPGREGTRLRRRLSGLFEKREPPPFTTAPDASERRRRLRAACDLLNEIAAIEPVLLSADDVQDADPLCIDLLSTLIEEAGAGTAGPRVAIAYRTESPYRRALRPLIDALSAPASHHELIELPPRLDRGGAVSDLTDAHRAYLHGLDGGRRVVLEALAVLARPSRPELLARILGRPRRDVREALAFLETEGVTRVEAGLHGLRHDSSASAIREAMDGAAQRGLHRRAALALARGPRVSAEAVARHWLESDRPGRGLRAVIAAARELARENEDRRALSYFRKALEMLPPRSREGRDLAVEAADAHARAGEHRRAGDILTSVLPPVSRTADDARLHARLGIFLHRAGDSARSTEHLEKALELLGGARGVRGLRERLQIECELAEIAIDRGADERADAICRRALEGLAARRGARVDPELLRSEMVLLETRAHLHLRRFEYPAARELFERSLEVGERAGAAAEQSLTLNNLGILHIQENRFEDARTCYERAEAISRGLGDDPGLAAIHSNLAVIHAKLGDPDLASRSMERAAFHEARCDSARTRFLRLHSAAMVDALFGRHATAIDGFKEATALGLELEDLRTVAFDLVYLAECHLHRGELKTAGAALERALGLGPDAPVQVKRMAAARRATLAALAGNAPGVREESRALEDLGAEGLAYLDAWNRLYVGWAQRLAGETAKARENLERALAFFESAAVPCGAAHAAIELAELDGDAGIHADQLSRLVLLRSRYTCGQGALRNPMLCARLLAGHARALLDREPPLVEQAAGMVTEAESYLIGRRLGGVEDAVRELKRRLQALSPGAPVGPSPNPWKEPGRGGDVDLLESIREAASELVRMGESEVGAERAGALRRQLRAVEERIREARRAAEERPRAARDAWGTGAILGSSGRIRELVALVRKLAPLPNAILIRGETGSGKELVARALHAESPRRERPFISVSCTALPGELLEAELFGYVRGSFSGAEEDRAGLLRAASGGTFLFDDVGDMHLDLQSKIVRVLDSGAVRPLGSEEEARIDARYLFTTKEDLRALARERRFRSDLLFRLGGLEVLVPPLRERLEDLPVLVDRFLEQAVGDGARPVIERGALRALEEHPWPGNVRELENLVMRLAIEASGPIRAEDVRRLLGDPAPASAIPPAFLGSGSLGELQAALEREYIARLYRKSGGDVGKVARALGIKERALFDRLRRLGIRLRDLKGRGRE